MISIIVPVYNVEKYLEKCILSILEQNFQDFELLLIIDGSKDRSDKICYKYAKLDKRISVFEKENGGLSDARNYGINKAKGEYLTFIDSDDWISNNFLENLYNAIKKTNKDISLCPFVSVYEDGKIICGNKNHFCEFTKIELLENLFFTKEKLIDAKINVMTWGKLYKRELFKDVEFPKGRLHEDVATTYLIFDKSNGAVYTNECKYFYLQRQGSIMGNLNYKANSNHLKNFTAYKKNYIEQIAYFENKNFSIYKEIQIKYAKKLLVGYALEKNIETNNFIKKQLDEIKLSEIKKLKENIILILFALYKTVPNIYKFIVSKLILKKRRNKKEDVK